MKRIRLILRNVCLPAAAMIIAGSLFCPERAYCGDSRQANTERINVARDALAEWIDLRRLISKERRDLEFGKEMLTQRIELVKRESDLLKDKIAATRTNIGDADRKRLALAEKNEQLKKTSDMLAATIIDLEKRTRELLSRVPEPIREKVKPLSQRMAGKHGDTDKRSLSERFQNVVGILNEINKFNREITVTSEVRELPDGTSVEVIALYCGLGQGYYASAGGSVAGVGTSTETGWLWTPANDSAQDILDAIAILRNEKAADFVHLPAQVE